MGMFHCRLWEQYQGGLESAERHGERLQHKLLCERRRAALFGSRLSRTAPSGPGDLREEGPRYHSDSSSIMYRACTPEHPMTAANVRVYFLHLHSSAALSLSGRPSRGVAVDSALRRSKT